MNNYKSKCNFCKYWSGKSCMVTPDSYYCKEASAEFYAWLQARKQPAQQRSR